MLGVADVGVDDPLEGQVVSGVEPVAEVLCLDGELAADGVLDVEHGRVEVGDGELVHGARESGCVCWGSRGKEGVAEGGKPGGAYPGHFWAGQHE